jgi:hypothetical protein
MFTASIDIFWIRARSMPSRCRQITLNKGKLRLTSFGLALSGRRTQYQLLRIAQQAISNAVRHAKPTVVNVSLLRAEVGASSPARPERLD